MSRRKLFLALSGTVLLVMVPVLALSPLFIERHLPGTVHVTNGSNLNILVTPGLLDFGDILVGTNVTRSFWVQNTGDAQLWLNATVLLDYNSTVMWATTRIVNGTRLQFPALSIPGETLEFAVTLGAGFGEKPGTYNPVIILTGEQR